MGQAREIDPKISALAAQRSRHPIEPAVGPGRSLDEMMGDGWFVRAQPAVEADRDLFA
jgi:hypothetical protein